MNLRRLLANIAIGFGLVMALFFAAEIVQAASIDSGDPGVVREVECGSRFYASCSARFYSDEAGDSRHVAAERPVDSGDRGKLVSGPFGDSFYSDGVDRTTFYVLPLAMMAVGVGAVAGGWVIRRKNRQRSPGG